MDTTTATKAPAVDASRTRRLPLLDVLRGVAILGTLGTNVWLFTSATGEATPLLGTGGGATDGTFLGAAAELLTNGKFLSMLTVLFGVGLALQHRSHARRSLRDDDAGRVRRWPGRYHWRALFLFAEGAVHFTLVFAWDVLMGYAVTAVLVAWLLTRSQRAQDTVMWTMLALHLAIIGLLTAAMGADQGGGTPVDPGIQEVYASGSWLDQVRFRLDNLAVFRIEMVVTGALLMFLFLLGVRLLRAGAFGMDDRGRRVRSRMLVWGLGIGLPLNLAAMLGPDELFFLERYVAAPVVMIGYIGLVGLGVEHVRRGTLLRSVESLGRTALSGYVLQNLLASAVCYGWGLGLAAKWGSQPWFSLALWAAIGLVLLAGSRLWLRRFRNGPVESIQKALIR